MMEKNNYCLKFSDESDFDIEFLNLKKFSHY